MRRALTAVLLSLLPSLVLAGSAQAAPPSLGAISATNIQGVSALLLGTVDPEGQPTTYRFQYTDQAHFEASGFEGAGETPSTTAGTGTEERPARAAISGLSPSSTYHYRLVATSPSGSTTSTPATFATTKGFGFLHGEEGFSAALRADGGAAVSQASSHPYQLDLSLALNQGSEFEGQPGLAFPDGDLRDLRIEMPPGLIANPNALEKCSLLAFHTPRASPFETPSRSGESCPDKSQVGTVQVRTSVGGGEMRRFGLFNLQPAPGVAIQLGFAPYGTPIALDTDLHRLPDSSYVMTLQASDFPQALDITAMGIALWGMPWAASHNGERGDCLNEAEPSFPWAKCSVGEPTPTKPENTPLAYLTLPARCSEALTFTASADAWQQPARASALAQSLDGAGHSVQLSHCTELPFEPQPDGFLTDTKASSASGYNFRLAVDNSTLTIPTQLVPSPTKQAIVVLPEGTTINPSVGAGLEGCAPSQYEAETPFNPQGAGCPNGAKIGQFSVRTPLFDEEIGGAIYLAQPDNPATSQPGAENPFDSLVAIYLVAKLPQRGILVKVAGKIAPDPGSGSITATFDGLPQLPYTDLNVDFRTGQRSFLITPARCGVARTKIDLFPWSGGPSFHRETSSELKTGIDEGPCPSGTPPFSPGAIAGGVNSNVGSYTPYFVHLIRKDTEQEITSYSLVLPKGITGKLAGVPFCSEADIDASRQKRGFTETAHPSCPQQSQVGRTLTGYGVGPALTYAPGRIYLAGPYHGSPLSLVTINSATVGPFDLGTIVIRSAFDVEEHTAQLQIDSHASDPIPHIIDGIPLHLREVRVYMDRYQFTHNPSSCEPSELVSTLTGSGARFDDKADDSTASISKRFQLLNCLTLGFQPRLGLRLRGGSHRGQYPQLRATFASRGAKDSNLKQIEVVMPHSEFLAQNHIREICTRKQFDQDMCPPDSVYGSALAYTPLFDDPLRGEVYLRSSTHRLPDLVASLHAGAIHIVAEGKIGPAKGGGIRAYFANLPDAPINRFVMTLNGGKRGLLVNTTNICKAPPLASVKALGQNNRGSVFTSRLRGQCGGKGNQEKGRRR
jgi:hypothetical protein